MHPRSLCLMVYDLKTKTVIEGLLYTKKWFKKLNKKNMAIQACNKKIKLV